MSDTTETKRGPGYWLVGATWEDTDMFDGFFGGDFWALGWNDDNAETRKAKKLFELAKQIQADDRIAIKRLNGKGQPDIRILAIGIVKNVIYNNHSVICGVRWGNLAKMDRRVDMHGAVSAITGPFRMGGADDDWLRRIFAL